VQGNARKAVRSCEGSSAHPGEADRQAWMNSRMHGAVFGRESDERAPVSLLNP